MSNRGQPAGLSSVNSTADERSASHAYTDRSKCLPLMIETPPVISLANNLRKALIFKFKDFFSPLICQHILLSLLTQM